MSSVRLTIIDGEDPELNVVPGVNLSESNLSDGSCSRLELRLVKPIPSQHLLVVTTLRRLLSIRRCLMLVGRSNQMGWWLIYEKTQ